MTFAYPSILFLLAIPVTLAFWEWTRAGHTLVMPFDRGGQRRGRVLKFFVLCANTLPATLLAIAILLLARPITFAPPQTERKLTNIQLVLDTSPSMSDKYGQQPPSGERYSRFDAAMDAIEQFLKFREGDAFGLTVFSRTYIHWVPLTLDTSAIINSRPFIKPFTIKTELGNRPKNLPESVWSQTWIATALEGAKDNFTRRPEGDRMIILLTDGESNDIRNGREHEVAAKMKEAKITVFAVNLSGDTIERGLETITRETGGDVFSAVDSAALQSVFRQIDQMKRVQILQKEPQVIDLFRPFFWPTAVLLTLQVLALFALRFTPW
jgi:Ca-activated chloride channel family protein